MTAIRIQFDDPRRSGTDFMGHSAGKEWIAVMCQVRRNSGTHTRWIYRCRHSRDKQKYNILLRDAASEWRVRHDPIQSADDII